MEDCLKYSSKFYLHFNHFHRIVTEDAFQFY